MWGNLAPSFVVRVHGDVPSSASKERAAHHHQTMSDGCAFQPPAGASLISTPRASELPPALVWRMPTSGSGPHSELPREVSPEKQRAIHVVSLLCLPPREALWVLRRPSLMEEGHCLLRPAQASPGQPCGGQSST